MNKSFCKELVKIRKHARLSVYRLSQLTGVTASAIYNIEKGAIPSATTCALLLKELGVEFSNTKISSLFKKKKKTLNMSLQRVARSINIGYGTLYKIERGYLPSMKTCCIIAKELNLPLEDFIIWPDEKGSAKQRKMGRRKIKNNFGE